MSGLRARAFTACAIEPLKPASACDAPWTRLSRQPADPFSIASAVTSRLRLPGRSQSTPIGHDVSALSSSCWLCLVQLRLPAGLFSVCRRQPRRRRQYTTRRNCLSDSSCRRGTEALLQGSGYAICIPHRERSPQPASWPRPPYAPLSLSLIPSILSVPCRRRVLSVYSALRYDPASQDAQDLAPGVPSIIWTVTPDGPPSCAASGAPQCLRSSGLNLNASIMIQCSERSMSPFAHGARFAQA